MEYHAKANCFQGTSIPVCCLVFKKERNGNSDNIFFIDASKEFVYETVHHAEEAQLFCYLPHPCGESYAAQTQSLP